MPGPPRLAVALNGYGLDHYELDGGYRDILPWSDLRSLGLLAEELGYERIFVPQIGGREAFSTLAGLAAATERIGLATGVIPLSDDVRTIGMGASSVDEMAGGRLVLGVGSNDSIERTAHLVRALREVLRGGEGIVADPEETRATGQLDWHTVPRAVPIYLAALGPRMVELAGRIADGVILNWCTPQRVAEARAAVGDREDFTLAVYVRLCLDQADELAMPALKTAVARYLRLAPYARQFAAMGFEEEISVAGEGLDRGGYPWEVVPDALARGVGTLGGRGEAEKRLGEFRDAGADLIVVYPVAADRSGKRARQDVYPAPGDVDAAVASMRTTLGAAAPSPAVEG